MLALPHHRRYCYAELLGAFYVCTKALERELAQRDSNLAQRVNKEINLAFTAGYEADLQHLLGDDWASQVDAMTSDVARRYISRIEGATEAELTAAVFILQVNDTQLISIPT